MKFNSWVDSPNVASTLHVLKYGEESNGYFGGAMQIMPLFKISFSSIELTSGIMTTHKKKKTDKWLRNYSISAFWWMCFTVQDSVLSIVSGPG